MYPHQWRRRVNVAHDKRDGFFDLAASLRAGRGAKSVDPEFAPACREICRGDWFNCFSVHALIIAAALSDGSEATFD